MPWVTDILSFCWWNSSPDSHNNGNFTLKLRSNPWDFNYKLKETFHKLQHNLLIVSLSKVRLNLNDAEVYHSWRLFYVSIQNLQHEVSFMNIDDSAIWFQKKRATQVINLKFIYWAAFCGCIVSKRSCAPLKFIGNYNFVVGRWVSHPLLLLCATTLLWVDIVDWNDETCNKRSKGSLKLVSTLPSITNIPSQCEIKNSINFHSIRLFSFLAYHSMPYFLLLGSKFNSQK